MGALRVAVGTEEKLRAIAQEKRIEILKILMGKRERWASARELAEGLGIKVSSLSVHLQILEKAGLIRRERAGRRLFVRLIKTPRQLIEEVFGD